MDKDGFITINCTVRKPKMVSVWIVLDGGKRSENLPLSCLHPNDLTEILAADRVHDRPLRIRADMAGIKRLTNLHNPDAACGDLFGGVSAK